MARVLVCDVCGKPTEEIVAKMFISPLRRGVTAHHAAYSHRLDVGACCQPKVMKAFRWVKRTTAKEYHERKRAS